MEVLYDEVAKGTAIIPNAIDQDIFLNLLCYFNYFICHFTRKLCV